MNVPSAFKLSAIGFTGILVLLTFSKNVLPKVQRMRGVKAAQ